MRLLQRNQLAFAVACGTTPCLWLYRMIVCGCLFGSLKGSSEDVDPAPSKERHGIIDFILAKASQRWTDVIIVIVIIIVILLLALPLFLLSIRNVVSTSTSLVSNSDFLSFKVL